MLQTKNSLLSIFFPVPVKSPHTNKTKTLDKLSKTSDTFDIKTVSHWITTQLWNFVPTKSRWDDAWWHSVFTYNFRAKFFYSVVKFVNYVECNVIYFFFWLSCLFLCFFFLAWTAATLFFLLGRPYINHKHRHKCDTKPRHSWKCTFLHEQKKNVRCSEFIPNKEKWWKNMHQIVHSTASPPKHNRRIQNLYLTIPRRIFSF